MTSRLRMRPASLPVRDLQKSMVCFARPGSEFDRKFTDEKATCMVVGEEGS